MFMSMDMSAAEIREQLTRDLPKWRKVMSRAQDMVMDRGDYANSAGRTPTQYTSMAATGWFVLGGAKNMPVILQLDDSGYRLQPAPKGWDIGDAVLEAAYQENPEGFDPDEYMKILRFID